tara:strand:- start:329 stop:472 length:144 start_codon:yes stop_codon:yes gene_type:complete
MAYVSFNHADAVHAAVNHHHIAWGRLAALAFAIGSWAAIIAGVRALF